MKPIRALSLTLLIVFYGMPLPVLAQGTPETFTLTEGTSGEVYRANIETILREKYRLRIETAASSSILQWAFVSGDMPSGLTLRTDGLIIGIPNVSESQILRFRAKVFDAAEPKHVPLVLYFSLSINVPSLKLTKITAPRLTIMRGGELANDNSEANHTTTIGERVSTEATSPGPTRSPAYRTTGDPIDDASGTSAVVQNTSCTGCDTTSCPICIPQTSDPQKTIIIDARGGSVTGSRKYKKGQHAQILIINKNPYIRAYTTKIDEKTVEETALNTFLPLLGSIIADQLKETPKEKVNNAEVANAQKAAPDPGCPTGSEVDFLTALKDRATTQEAALKGSYDALAARHKVVAANYKTGVDTLSNPQNSCQVLYCTSLSLRSQLEQRVSDASIKEVQDASDGLKNLANTLKQETELMRRQYQTCSSQLLNEYGVLADGLLSRANEVETSLNKVKDDNKKFEKAAEAINQATGDSRNFAEVYEIPEKRSTDIATVTLSAKNLKGLGGEPEGKSADIASVEVQFGEAPYFALSGGIATSTLEKTEYQRVQGFATNRQGQVTGTQITSIVGVKEDSSTRITPILILHGRLYRPSVESLFSGLHWSLGITGKNDNKGTDIEYLIGPSASFLNDKLFFTVGAYAGKRQTLDGNLFPGAEVPKDLAEIPVHKNYHWKLGFGLTYRLPLPK